MKMNFNQYMPKLIGPAVLHEFGKYDVKHITNMLSTTLIIYSYNTTDK